MIDVYIGWDSREQEAYDVCRHSMILKSTEPLHIKPLRINALRYMGLYRRSKDEDGTDCFDHKPFSTEFAFTRFLIPALMQYEGWAIFCDCDFLWRDDISKLWDMRDDKYAVMCVKHDHRPEESVKMDGQKQTRYFRKNWSSLMMWNCGHEWNKALTVDAVNTKPGSYLHAFSWIPDESIGEIPVEWNWLEGYSEPCEPKAVHFTRGGPWFKEYEDVEYADEYRAVLLTMKAKYAANRRSVVA